MRARLLLLCAALSCGKSLVDLEPFHCAADGTCPNGYICIEDFLCQEIQSCNPVQSQNACTGATSRCAVVEFPGDHAPVNTGAFVAQCVAPLSGAQGLGETCSGGSTGTLYADPDTCGAGMLCYEEGAALGAHETSPHCRAFCHANSDCGTASFCAIAFSGPQFSSLSSIGVCEPRCDFNGTPCSVPGQHCDALPGVTGGTAVLLCRDDGAAKDGESCATVNCKAGLVCVPGIAPFQAAPICRVPCNNTNMLCAVGTCETAAYSMGGGFGFCH